MFIEQLFQWWQLVPARPRGIVFNRGTEREREQAKCCLAAVLQRNATPAGCTGDYSGTDITRAGWLRRPGGRATARIFQPYRSNLLRLGSGASIVGSVLGIFVFGPVIRLDGLKNYSLKKYSFERQDSLNCTCIIIQYVLFICVSVVTTFILSYLNEIKRWRGKIVGDRFLHRQFAVHACIPRIVNVCSCA